MQKRINTATYDLTKSSPPTTGWYATGVFGSDGYELRIDREHGVTLCHRCKKVNAENYRTIYLALLNCLLAEFPEAKAFMQDAAP